jgi:hypothetical protein
VKSDFFHPYIANFTPQIIKNGIFFDFGYCWLFFADFSGWVNVAILFIMDNKKYLRPVAH